MTEQQALQQFERHRSQLFGLVYRITGSVFESEDILQETLIRWLNGDRNSVQEPQAWLMKVATRLALDHLKSARVQREAYVGPWLPEPLLDQQASPENELELDQTLSIALLLLLQQLSPAERAAYLLHDVFHFNFEEIGSMLERTGASCRKLASRARGKIDLQGLQPKPADQRQFELVSSFFRAVKEGDMEGLVGLLKSDVSLQADGGGKASAVKKTLLGAKFVSKFLLSVVQKSFSKADQAGAEVEYLYFNGAPGFVVRIAGVPLTAFNFDISEQGIERIHVHRNPDKLRLFDTFNRSH